MKKITYLLALSLLVVSACTLTNQNTVQAIPLEEAKTMALDFINNNLMQPGTQVSVNEIAEEGDLYRVSINIPGQTEPIDSYMTKDGKKFFPQAMDIETADAPADDAQASTPPPPANVVKAAKPNVELFVMSHCPYGTQIEKGFLPVAKTLGDKIDYEIKFVDYAMHGEKEIDEQLNQYCIQGEQNDKFIPYLECFLEADDGPGCLTSTGIDIRQMDTCVAKADQAFKIKENFADKTTWKSGRFPLFDIHKEDNAKYGITGSPGLVVNGAKVTSGRSPQALLTTICAGFEDQPEECNTQLDSASPSAGFGFSTGGSAAAAECGS
jgi:hypothetical protein